MIDGFALWLRSHQRARCAPGLMLALVLGGSGLRAVCSAQTLDQSPTRTASRVSASPIRLVISSDKSTYSLGEVPRLTARLSNVSPDPIWVIGCLQGSEQTEWPIWAKDRFGVVWNVGKGQRYPRYVVKVQLNDQPATVEIKGAVTPCGNMNALIASDFKLLAPSEAFDPFGEGFFHLWTLRQPELWNRRGVYKLSLLYDTRQGDNKKFCGDGSIPDFAERLKDVPRLAVSSNELALVVR